MNEAEGFKAVVPSDLRDLVPTFLRNRKSELEALREALAAADFQQVLHLSHRMKGVGECYGFPDISAIGARIAESANLENRDAIARLLLSYAQYLDGVRIVYGPPS